MKIWFAMVILTMVMVTGVQAEPDPLTWGPELTYNVWEGVLTSWVIGVGLGLMIKMLNRS